MPKGKQNKTVVIMANAILLLGFTGWEFLDCSSLLNCSMTIVFTKRPPILVFLDSVFNGSHTKKRGDRIIARSTA